MTSQPTEMCLYTEPIICEQVFSRNALGFLWAKRDELDPGVSSILDALYKNRRKGSVDGSARITYSLPKTGAGKLGFGRMYGSKGGMETLEKECRGTLCEQFYYDIDVKNAHPVILVQFAKRYYNVDMVEVGKYCDNRDAYLAQISDNRDEAKTAIIKIFYNGANEYPFLKKLQDEIKGFIKTHLMNDKRYSQLLAYVKKQDGNTYGTFLSYILHTEERRIMLAMRSALFAENWKVDVLAYDGVMIRKDPKNVFDESLLRRTEEAVCNKTGYTIELVNKKFESYEVPANDGEVDFKVSKEMYDERKAEFEENHFYYAPSNTIAEVNGDNIAFYEIPHAKTMFIKYDFTHSKLIKDRTSFIDLWLHDNNRRTITNIDQKPSDDPNTYSPPTIFRYTTFEDADDQGEVKLFLDLVDILTGKQKPLAEYLLNWTAHIIQKPFENPKTAIILTGEKGCGKDTYGDLISEWIVGEKYYHNYTSTTQFWDKYDCDRLNKFFIKLEEASGALNRQHIGEMKARITAHNQTFNPKGVKSMTTNNYNRFLFTSNEAKPVQVEDAERRFNVFACSADQVGKHEYWDEIRNMLFCPRGAAVIGKYLATLDISKFDPRKLPENAYQNHIIESEQSAEAQFIKNWDGADATATELFHLYQYYCRDNELPYVKSAQMLGHRLCKFIRDGVLQKKKVTEAMVYFKPGAQEEIKAKKAQIAAQEAQEAQIAAQEEAVAQEEQKKRMPWIKPTAA